MGNIRTIIVSTALSLLTLTGATTVLAGDLLKDTLWEEIALTRNIDPALLYSVALKEARQLYKLGLARPHPWTLRTSKGPQIYKSLAEAQIGLALALQSDPSMKIDIGMMQVNWYYHKHRVNNAFELLNPKKSIEIGADILADAIASKPGDLAYGVGSYFSGQENRARKYGNDVIRMANEIRNM